MTISNHGQVSMSDNDDPNSEVPEVVEPTPESAQRSQRTEALNTVLRDSSQPTERPRRMASDVWAVMREYVEGGGLLDMAEDVAALSALEQEVRRDSEGDDAYLTKKDKVDAIVKIVDRRSRVKESYLKMHKERQNFITFEMFSMFLEDLFQILNQHISDPALLREIGEDLATAAQVMQRRINGG